MGILRNESRNNKNTYRTEPRELKEKENLEKQSHELLGKGKQVKGNNIKPKNSEFGEESTLKSNEARPNREDEPKKKEDRQAVKRTHSPQTSYEEELYQRMKEKLEVVNNRTSEGRKKARKSPSTTENEIEQRIEETEKEKEAEQEMEAEPEMEEEAPNFPKPIDLPPRRKKESINKEKEQIYVDMETSLASMDSYDSMENLQVTGENKREELLHKPLHVKSLAKNKTEAAPQNNQEA